MSEGQYGYGGNIIRVDLSSGQIEMAPTADYATFVGGRGIGPKSIGTRSLLRPQPLTPKTC